jgi:hypothetical protein
MHVSLAILTVKIKLAMKYILTFLLVLTSLNSNVFGQSKYQSLKGKVTFVTSKNVYVKFENTKDINSGDTLYLSDKKTACLLVKSKSSSSAVCSTLNNCEIKKDDEVFYLIKADKNIIEDKTINENIDSIKTKKEKRKESKYKSKFRGRISVSSYSTLSDVRDNRNRITSRISLDAKHINNSKFSFETYATYRKNLNPSESNSFQKNDNFNVYDLALQYDANPTLSLTIGRKINSKISSIGAIDGLQVEKHLGKNYVGAIAGFRPDIFDYGFNSDLFEYGAYFGRKTDYKNFYSQTTLGFIEQRNNSEIDRRYTYFQHSSTIFKKLNIFSSLELDIYNKLNNVSNNNIRLTNLYTSARYRFSRQLDLSLSYDSRKRILYYETFQTQIERLLNDDIARQGVRIRLNVRPKEFLNVGLSYSKRFQSNNENKSDNIYTYLSLTNLPGIGGRISVNYNVNSSNYLESNVLSLRHSRTFLNNKLNADFYFRFVNYTYLNSNTALSNGTLTQSYYGTNLSLNINRGLVFSVSGEFSNSSLENNYRIYTRLVKRFYKKKRKK